MMLRFALPGVLVLLTLTAVLAAKGVRVERKYLPPALLPLAGIGVGLWLLAEFITSM